MYDNSKIIDNFFESFPGVGCLTNNRQFDCDANLDYDPDPVIVQRNVYHCEIRGECENLWDHLP